MPIFISYNHRDAAFAEALAQNLLRQKHHVWIDKWEMNVGDSLADRVQQALTRSSAVLVILSPNSVESGWCRRELNAALVREIEEKSSIILPCLIADCEIPLFLRDKLYADFRSDADEAFWKVLRSLDRVTNQYQARTETPEYHTDWSIDWHLDSEDGISWVRWTFIDHTHSLPYTILSTCSIMTANEASNVALHRAVNSNSRDEYFGRLAAEVEQRLGSDEQVTISGHMPEFIAFNITLGHEEYYHVVYDFRRLGMDNGMNTVVYLGNNIRMAKRHLEEVGMRASPTSAGSTGSNRPSEPSTQPR